MPRRHRLLVLALLAGLAATAPARASSPGNPAFVVDGGTQVSLAPSTRLVLDCDLRNAGAFSPLGGAVVVSGYGSPVLLGVPHFFDLTLASHGTASLANAVTVDGAFTLSSGWLSLAGHDLTANTIVGGSAGAYVVTPDTLGRLVRKVTPAATVAFPVGNTGYDPVTLRTTSANDNLRVAVVDAPPPGLTPAVALSRAWAITGVNAPGLDGTITATVQWNAGEQGASFDRTFGNATSALAWRWNGATWSAQPGVRTTDNGAFPAIDQLLLPATGLWTLAGLGSALAVEPAGPPASLALAAPTPNPIARTGAVRYALPGRARVSLALYSVTGARIATLADGEQDAGWHVASIDASRLAGGIYFCRLESGGVARSSKLIVVK